MANWATRNVGGICIAGFTVIAAAGFTLSYQLGQNTAAYEAIRDTVNENGKTIESTSSSIVKQISSLEKKLNWNSPI